VRWDRDGRQPDGAASARAAGGRQRAWRRRDMEWMGMDAWVWWLVALGVWLALNVWILPRLGVPT